MGEIFLFIFRNSFRIPGTSASIFLIIYSGEWWLHGAGAVSHQEEISYIQGKEQWLQFAGAVK